MLQQTELTLYDSLVLSVMLYGAESSTHQLLCDECISHTGVKRQACNWCSLVTSTHTEIMHRAVCLFTLQLSPALIAPTQGWPG